MALPPTIPTSFVPKQPVTSAPKHRTSGANPFLALAYLVTGLVVVGCFAVFGYGLYLDNVAKTKANDVTVAQNSIDQETVTSFIRLRDRFTTAKDVLNNHVVLSQFFDDLESLTIQGVQFRSFKIIVNDDRSASVVLAGSARTFNILAAQSAAIGADKRIKRAIFSGIQLNPKDNSVAFSLSADIDSSLITWGATGAAAPVVPTQPTTPTPPPAQPATSTQPVKAATTTP